MNDLGVVAKTLRGTGSRRGQRHYLLRCSSPLQPVGRGSEWRDTDYLDHYEG